MWDFFGNIASGIMGLFGGKTNADAQLQANRENAAAAERNAVRNIEYQKEFAKSGIQWRAEDAQKAGIHPIYALGAGGASFSPVSIAGGEARPVTGMGDAMQRAGQNFGRAIQAAQPRDAQMDAITRAAAELQLTNAGLNNELLATQVAKARQELITKPAMPSLEQRYGIEGQGSTAGASGISANDYVRGNWPKQEWTEKAERVPRAPGEPHREAFSVADVGHANTAGGGYSAIPSKDVQERIEDNFLQQVMWMFRNNLLPSIGINESPPRVPAGEGKVWRYHPFYQEYRRHTRGRYFDY